MGTGGVLVDGIIFHYTRINGQLIRSKRWAYVSSDSLFIFPDVCNPNTCYRVYLVQADLGISYEEDDTPWITITERNNATYFIQPERAYDFNKWFNALQEASECKGPVFGSSEARDFHAPQFPHTTEWDQNERHEARRIKHSQPSRRKPALRDSPVVQVGREPARQANPIWSETQEQRRTSVDRPTPPARPRHRKLTSTPTIRNTATSQLDEEPPPRPPRSSTALHTVKEHPSMKDSEIAVTKPLSELQSRYPVSGLAKRMSISASDLFGKSRDELILLLLQLNREKANLQRWFDYFTKQIELIQADKGGTSAAEEELSAIRVELADVTGQLRLSEPMVKFLANMLRMGDLYAGDDVMFASEYRKHLLSENELVPPKDSINFARAVEAQDVARSLDASRRQMGINSGHATPVVDDSPNLASWIAEKGAADDTPARLSNSISSSKTNIRQWPEPTSFRQKRMQLESELADLEALCEPHDIIHQELRATQKSLRQFEPIRPRENMTPIGPSATLVRRIKGDPRGRRSSIPSIGGSLGRANQFLYERDQFYTANDDLDFQDQTLGEQDKRGSWRPRRYLSTTSQSGRFTPISALTREDSIKRFRSIPEHLNLLGSTKYQLDLRRSQTYDWGSGRLLSTTANPTDEMPTKFSPVRSVQHRSAYRARSSLESRVQPTGELYNTHPDGRASNAPSREERRRSGQRTSYSSEAIENDVSDLMGRQIRRRSSALTDDLDSFIGYKRNTDDRCQPPSNVSLVSSQVREKPVSLDDYKSDSFRDNENIYGNLFITPRQKEKERSSQLDGYIEDRLISYGPSVISKQYQPESRTRKPDESSMRHYRTENNLVAPRQGFAEESESRSKSKTPNAEPFRMIDSGTKYEVENDGDSATLFSTDSEIPSNLFLRDFPLQSPPPQSGGDSHSIGRTKRNAKRLQSPDGAVVSNYLEPENDGYPFTTESVESVFAPPEPMDIGARYVPSPPAREPTDPEYRQNKEKRLSALRDVLLRQRSPNEFQ
ncbi:hypothetical protein CSKR_102807 [Clonorchis sinensis]|uniref:PH domain-containing protein n=2 Tax=Clonorchis sinensis TaxID=79923 RepID=A0A8T1MAA4_CLOSI|nr:hypothetical protein CSKR_102807 [Clonorchis sinensis]